MSNKLDELKRNEFRDYYNDVMKCISKPSHLDEISWLFLKRSLFEKLYNEIQKEFGDSFISELDHFKSSENIDTYVKHIKFYEKLKEGEKPGDFSIENNKIISWIITDIMDCASCHDIADEVIQKLNHKS